MSKEDPSTKIAVIIATQDRCRILSERALSSVVAQAYQPDYLIVVDDSSHEVRSHNAALVASLHLPDCEVSYHENRHSEGASGSWNTAIDILFTKTGDPERVFIAILDDDDSWSSSYLRECCVTACDRQLDMVAADIRRFESIGGAPLIGEAPTDLRAEDFLTGNPGIQGSNLFLRLSVLLAAGGFDEELRSTTDRDLCIRIADLGTVRYGRLPLALVDHYADSDRPRLSTRGSEAKLEGLTAFWKKYFGRMSAHQEATFLNRAASLFDWYPPPGPALTETPASDDMAKADPVLGLATDNVYQCEAPQHEPFTLCVGVITSDPPMLRPLLSGLAFLQKNTCIKHLCTLILNNGCSISELDEEVQRARLAGLEIAVASESQQRRDAAEGAFGTTLRIRPAGQVGIAQARTMLQKYLGTLMELNHGAFGWILDDDMRSDDRAGVYLPWLPEFRKQGIDVLIGACEGSSPNPPLNGLRVQLVDIFHNLVWIQNLPSEVMLPDRSDENSVQRAKFPDYYYDLSRKHSGHLESPHWLEPIHQTETVAEARSRLLAGALGILNGDPLTRPIVTSMPSNPLAAARDSVNRGGCTFVLNPHSLTHTPNTITQIQGREARRSDMVWAIVNRYYRSMNVKAVGFPIHHVGRVTGIPSINAEKVQDEIVGSALYAGLSEFLDDRPQHELKFSLSETQEIVHLAEKHMDWRLCSLEQSFYRIAGLCEAIRSIVTPGELDGLLGYLERGFTHEEFHRIRSGVKNFSNCDVKNFLASLRSVADDFSLATVNTDFILDQLCTEPTLTTQELQQ